MLKNLSEYSKAYYGLNNVYERFSACEDYPNLVAEELTSIIKGRIVLDAGCGTGKYLEKLENITEKLYGIDASNEQLEIAKQKVKHDIKLICSDLESIDLEDNTFDVIYCTWVLGTVKSIRKRNEILREFQRLLKQNGVIILVENNIGGEFEILRNRYPNIFKTKKYNDWILKHDFKVLKEIDTYFKFKSDREAFNVFNNIYGEEIANHAKKRINHKVIIYYLTSNKK
jgi:ubiquinone/menaquinone biosynthesis C-methylase UbiE